MKTTKLPDEHVETITVETHNDWNVFILRQSTIGNAQRPAVDNSIVMTQDQLAKLVATQQNAHPPPLTLFGMRVEIANWLKPGQWFIRPSRRR